MSGKKQSESHVMVFGLFFIFLMLLLFYLDVLNGKADISSR